MNKSILVFSLLCFFSACTKPETAATGNWTCTTLVIEVFTYPSAYRDTTTEVSHLTNLTKAQAETVCTAGIDTISSGSMTTINQAFLTAN